ncbi:putative LRR receptor-like serine/threonine-protein kinase [Nymphaea thermarum]|nr:putative LRR receptor-like serine/threonine-protein kinase [Nymphaea thermarum]
MTGSTKVAIAITGVLEWTSVHECVMNMIIPIPDSIVQLSNLTKLDLSGNSSSGEIPPGLLNHPNLRYLNLSSNNLTGPLLAQLDLSYNMLVGKIPSSITNLRHLATLDLAGNRLDGTVHLSLFQNLTNLSSLILSDNELTVDQAANFSCMQLAMDEH